MRDISSLFTHLFCIYSLSNEMDAKWGERRREETFPSLFDYVTRLLTLNSADHQVPQ